MKRLLPFGLLAALAAGCGDDGGAGDGGTGADAGTAGALEIVGNWPGAKPDGAAFQVALFACPFTMPPDYYSGDDGTLDLATGDVYLFVEGVEAGERCVMAYVDMDTTDGLMPVDGLDATTATGLENEYGAIPVEIAAGGTTTLELTFAVR